MFISQSVFLLFLKMFIFSVMLDPPGPPRAQVLKKQREVLAAANIKADRGSMAIVTNREEPEPHSTTSDAPCPPGTYLETVAKKWTGQKLGY